MKQKFQLKNGSYIFGMEYAGAINSLSSSGMSIYWNGRKMIHTIASDNEVHELQIDFVAVDGENIL